MTKPFGGQWANTHKSKLQIRPTGVGEKGAGEKLNPFFFWVFPGRYGQCTPQLSAHCPHFPTGFLRVLTGFFFSGL